MQSFIIYSDHKPYLLPQVKNINNVHFPVMGLSIKEIKEQEKERRRSYILDTAEKLFFSKGYDNVSMDDIANEVELSKATLYLYFKDKESLYFGVVNRGIKILRAMIA
jgi:AcrR family transcriptional regulator